MGKRSISGLSVEDLTIGTGAEAVKGKTVTIQAVGGLNRGDIFVSTLAHGSPWKFQAGGHKAIAGLAKGVLGMRVGGKRRVRVSPHLGYRDQSYTGNSAKFRSDISSRAFGGRRFVDFGSNTLSCVRGTLS